MSLDFSGIDKIVSAGKYVPSNIDTIYYLFFDKGVDFIQFSHLPIPYIITIINVHSYIKTEEEKAHKKAMRKK